MKTRSIKTLNLNKKSISNLVEIQGGRAPLSTASGSANCNSKDICPR